MNKLYKHLPHKLKRRVVKKQGAYAYNVYLGFHKISVDLARAGYRDVGLEWRKTARERGISDDFIYSGHIGGAFVWIDSLKGMDYWYTADKLLAEYKIERGRRNG